MFIQSSNFYKHAMNIITHIHTTEKGKIFWNFELFIKHSLSLGIIGANISQNT